MRTIILGGSHRGKTTLASQISLAIDTVLCTDPQRLCAPGVTGTPDNLDYSGDNGVAAWVCAHWFGDLGMPSRTCIEGVKAADALRRWCFEGPSSEPYGKPTSELCDRVILLTERVGDDPLKRGQEQQHEHTLRVVTELLELDLLDNLELWRPLHDGTHRFEKVADAHHLPQF